MNIDFANLQLQYQNYKQSIDSGIDAVLNKSNFIMGEEVKLLEVELSALTKAKHSITCASGTDALILAMMALDIQPGDEIITTPFTFIATAETISLMHAVPVFVDIEPDTFNIDALKIEDAITSKTKAIMPVSLYGQPADMDTIQTIADQHNLKVIIDGAQSFGSTFNGISDSALGDISTTSFFPAKPLGCFGDGGAVFTMDDELANKMKMLRVHGQVKRYHHKYIGIGGRLDTIQAAVLRAKLIHYPNELNKRQEVADKYSAGFQNENFVTPELRHSRTSAWAQYTIRTNDRESLQSKLKDAGIPTAVHYPMPLHIQECFQHLNYNMGDFPVSEKASKEVMSLPMNAFLTDEEIKYIISNTI